MVGHILLALSTPSPLTPFPDPLHPVTRPLSPVHPHSPGLHWGPGGLLVTVGHARPCSGHRLLALGSSGTQQYTWLHSSPRALLPVSSQAAPAPGSTSFSTGVTTYPCVPFTQERQAEDWQATAFPTQGVCTGLRWGDLYLGPSGLNPHREREVWGWSRRDGLLQLIGFGGELTAKTYLDAAKLGAEGCCHHPSLETAGGGGGGGSQLPWTQRGNIPSLVTQMKKDPQLAGCSRRSGLHRGHLMAHEGARAMQLGWMQGCPGHAGSTDCAAGPGTCSAGGILLLPSASCCDVRTASLLCLLMKPKPSCKAGRMLLPAAACSTHSWDPGSSLLPH